MHNHISIIGLGKLGLPFAVSWASRGFHVNVFDVQEQISQRLSQGEVHEAEKPVESLLTEAKARIHSSKDTEDAVLASDVTFVIVATPSENDGKFSTEYVERAMKAVGNALRRKTDFHLVVLVSTVMPGTCESIVKALLERTSGKKCGNGFGLCYNPELIALGEVVRGLLRPDLVVIGQSDPRSGNLLENLYKRFCENAPSIRRMSLWNAELTKISLNVFITMKIAFANNLAALCEQTPEGNVDAVTDALGDDPRIGSLCLKAGLSYGGPCFPRDNRAFSYGARSLGGIDSLSVATDESNVAHNSRIVQKIIEDLKAVSNPQVAFLGLTYKPNTNVVEESAAIIIARSLVDRGIRIKCYDPAGMHEAEKMMGDKIKYSENIEECLADSDLCVIATPWTEFKKLRPSVFLRHMRRAAILDCWRILDGAKFARVSTLSYSAIGVAESRVVKQSRVLPSSKHRRIESLVMRANIPTSNLVD